VPGWDTTDAAVAFGDGILTGEHVRLRALDDGDLKDLCGWWRDPGTNMLQAGILRPTVDSEIIEQFRKWCSNTSGLDVGLSVESLENREFIGHVSLFGATLANRCATLGIFLGRSFWSKGFGADAVRTVVRYGFAELGLHRIQLGVWAFNTRAVAAYRTAGFREEGRRREVVFHDGVWYDELLMGQLETEWRADRVG